MSSSTMPVDVQVQLKSLALDDELNVIKTHLAAANAEIERLHKSREAVHDVSKEGDGRGSEDSLCQINSAQAELELLKVEYEELSKAISGTAEALPVTIGQDLRKIASAFGVDATKVCMRKTGRPGERLSHYVHILAEAAEDFTKRQKANERAHAAEISKWKTQAEQANNDKKKMAEELNTLKSNTATCSRQDGRAITPDPSRKQDWNLFPHGPAKTSRVYIPSPSPDFLRPTSRPYFVSSAGPVFRTPLEPPIPLRMPPRLKSPLHSPNRSGPVIDTSYLTSPGPVMSPTYPKRPAAYQQPEFVQSASTSAAFEEYYDVTSPVQFPDIGESPLKLFKRQKLAKNVVSNLHEVAARMGLNWKYDEDTCKGGFVGHYVIGNASCTGPPRPNKKAAKYAAAERAMEMLKCKGLLN